MSRYTSRTARHGYENFSSERDALVALFRARGYEGREGGWIYDADGRPVGQGWERALRHLAGYLPGDTEGTCTPYGYGARIHAAARRAWGQPIAPMPLAVEQTNGRWVYTDLAIFALHDHLQAAAAPALAATIGQPENSR